MALFKTGVSLKEEEDIFVVKLVVSVSLLTSTKSFISLKGTPQVFES